MARIRIVRAEPRYLAQGKRFQTVLQADSGRIISRGKPTVSRKASYDQVATVYSSASINQSGAGSGLTEFKRQQIGIETELER